VHPFGDLSAYLDGALSAEAYTSVQAHLDTCAVCRTRLAELRGTARLIAALPMPVPSRSLVPRVSVPFWLAPLRTFSTFASGAAIFLFLASAVLSSFPRAVGTSAGPGAGGAPAAAPSTLSAPQPGLAADSSTSAPSEFKATAPSATPGTAAQRAAQSATPPDATPPDAPNQVGREEAAGASPDIATDTRLNRAAETSPFAVLSAPWLWLILGLSFAGLSFILGRRLRST
jgi:anti-sigma factor RsiW